MIIGAFMVSHLGREVLQDTSNRVQNTVQNDSALDSMNIEIFQNQNYINQLSELMESVSDRGATIAQLKDGTVFVSETRIVVYKYIWDSIKCIFVKQRTRNTRNSAKNQKIYEDSLVDEDIEM